MAKREVLTIAEAAKELNLSWQRIHQLMASGELDGVDLPAGRKRHAPGTPRVFAGSVDRLRRLRADDERQKAAARNAARAPRKTRPSSSSGRTAPRSSDEEVESATAAAWEMKVRLDAARDHLRAERARTKKALDVAASLLDLLRERADGGDEFDELAEGYSDAMTQLLAPDVPPHA